VIDFYGKFCYNQKKAKKVFEAIIKVWGGKEVKDVLKEYSNDLKCLPGYDLEYILYALKWILEQEDINFQGRSEKLQEKIDSKLSSVLNETSKNREGSKLPISLFWDILNGIHPVEALLSANIDIVPKFRKKG
ncbi:MAG: hypothetical protein QXV73_05875, partial [Candidatus Micrarchaeia archaeon]